MTLLSPAHIDQFRTEGATRVEGAFEPRWVDALAGATRDVTATWRAGALVADQPDNIAQNETRIFEMGGAVMITNIIHQHPAFRAFISDSPAAELVAGVLGSLTARFWIDATFWKSGGGAEGATPWHNDMCTYPWRGEQIAILWLALTDTGPDDAPLQTIAGSHHGDGRYASPLSPQGVDIPPDYKPWSDLLAQAADPGDRLRTWEAKAGDCLLMHPKLIHGSRPMGPAAAPERLSFSTRWLGDDMVWRPDVMCPPIPKLMGSPLMEVGKGPPDALLPAQWPRAKSAQAAM